MGAKYSQADPVCPLFNRTKSKREKDVGTLNQKDPKWSYMHSLGTKNRENQGGKKLNASDAQTARPKIAKSLT